MDHDRLGLREYVAIGAAGVAILFALFYFAPTASSGSDPLAIRTGVPVTAAVPTEAASPTPTPRPAAALADPGRWFIRHYSGQDPASSVVDGEAFFPSLNISYDGAPYPGLRDNGWSLTATSETEVAEGRYTFTLLLDGDVRVKVADQEPEAGADTTRPRELTVTFDHPGGKLRVEITGVDRNGPLAVRWK
ncbi:MAG: hypothetical protein IT303_06300 [Dehalococcoidia bacterium]|nr:hypothetical protein [Dehalococcoidia bacterium]